MSRWTLLFLFVALPLHAADIGKLMRQADRGSTSERTAALRELAKEDAGLATQKAVEWLAPNVEPALRRQAARTLWDLAEKAKPAETALRSALGDRDDDVAYAAVGALNAMGVPKADLRATRLRLARSSDGFIAFYAVRALHPDPELPVDETLGAAFSALNLAASGRPSDMKTRDSLRTNARAFLEAFAAKSGREGFDALMAAFPKTSPPAREAIAVALRKVPTQHGDPVQIAALLDSPQIYVRTSALYALSEYHERAAPVVDRMIALLATNHEPDLRKAAASALGYTGAAPGLATDQAKTSAWRSDVEKRIGPALANTATTDPVTEVRKEAAGSLQKLALWAGPALGAIGERIAREPDPVVRHALVRACWNARESPQLPKAVLASLAEGDPEQYVRNEAKSVLQAAGR
ncbi:MAG: HEAT repeat domain-containing protein [Betaproteobacteria bacterium]|nr:HEAT repeat domain-containing protein [Betaproteobacteria bacterium]